MRNLILTASILVILGEVYAAEKPPLPPPPPPVKITHIHVAPRYPGHSLPPGVSFFRRSKYEVWQYYGVDQRGYWKPIVRPIPGTPYGYYLYNGQKYPWLSTHPEIYRR